MVLANAPTFVEDERGIYPPIGLLSIAAYLRERGPSGIEVLVLDTVLENYTDEQIEAWLRREAPDVVGVQTLTFTLLDALAVVKLVKKTLPTAITVLGGRHCDIYPVETLSQPGVDFVVMGEGEETMTRLIEHLREPDILESVSGLVFKRGDRVVRNPSQMLSNLDDLPFPARELTAWKDYRYLLAKKSIFTTLITSRGCPYSCVFCDEGHQRFRSVSASKVVEEIQDCKLRLGIDHFFIFDSTFTIDRQRVLDICRLLVERKVDITFDVRSRVNLVDQEMLRALRRAGCVRIQYGVESGNDKVLEAISKRITVDLVRDVVKETRAHGFEILCDFMIGLPGETQQEVEDTIRLSLELPIDYAQFAITVPYPNTKLYELGIARGLFDDYWEEFSRNPSSDFQPKFWDERLSGEQLIAMMMNAYERFYFRPRFLIRQLYNIKSTSELYRKAKAGMNLMVRSITRRLGNGQNSLSD